MEAEASSYYADSMQKGQGTASYKSNAGNSPKLSDKTMTNLPTRRGEIGIARPQPHEQKRIGSECVVLAPIQVLARSNVGP